MTTILVRGKNPEFQYLKTTKPLTKAMVCYHGRISVDKIPTLYD